MVTEVLVLEVLDHSKHVQSSSVKVLLHVQFLVCQVVHEGSFLDIIVFSIETDIFHLFLGVSEVSELLLLSHISPHAAELLGFVSSVNIVEDCEFGPNKVGEVSDLNVSKVECDQVLVVEDHATDPFVVRPPSES